MGADRGYFVRIDGDRPSRPRRQWHIPISVVVFVLAAAGLLWMQAKEGGVRGQVEHAIDRARGAVESATTDPSLKRAATYFNEQYARDGHYTDLTEAAQRDDPKADWGVGVVVDWCNPQAMVLRSLTGAGTVSRLLFRGNDLGDALGEHDCPSDYTNPRPWKLPNGSG